MVVVLLNAERQTVRHPVSLVPDNRKVTMPEPVRYRNDTPMPALEHSGTGLRYQNAAAGGIELTSMPMPSYATY